MNRWTRFVNFLATNSTDRKRCAACRALVGASEDRFTQLGTAAGSAPWNPG